MIHALAFLFQLGRRRTPRPGLVPGTCVRLNSGGPVGVVRAVLDGDRVEVTWLNSRLGHSFLPSVCLTRTAQAPPPPFGQSPSPSLRDRKD